MQSRGQPREPYEIWGSGNQIQVHDMFSTDTSPHTCLRAHIPEGLWHLSVSVCHTMPLWFVCPFWEPAMGTKRHFCIHLPTIWAWERVTKTPQIKMTRVFVHKAFAKILLSLSYPKPHHRLHFGPTCYSFPFRWQLRLSPPRFHSPGAHSIRSQMTKCSIWRSPVSHQTLKHTQ